MSDRVSGTGGAAVGLFSRRAFHPPLLVLELRGVHAPYTRGIKKLREELDESYHQADY